ncbi:MAG: helix-hairpin-helix domain-containing protein, partial [Nitrospirota bacterium]
KSKAYYNAARTIETLTEDVGDLVASGRIRELKGIGQALAGKLAELVGTGRLAYYDELRQSVPAGLLEMTTIPGLGPKKITTVWNQLGITTVGELEYACIENRLVGLPGFGQKSQDKVRQGIQQLKRRRGFHLYANVIGEAERILEVIRHSAGVRHAELVGELRRRLEVVRTISVLVSADGLRSVLEGLRQVEGLGELTQAGSTITGKSSLGVPVRVMVSEGMTAHAMLAASASEEHLAALSARAARMKVPWNLMGANGMAAPKADSEGALYAALALQFIEPELREGLGEIEAAESGRLKPLVEAGQIRGIFHNHTTYSDGSASLEDMVAAAKALGYRYIGISDHSQSAFYANGL